MKHKLNWMAGGTRVPPPGLVAESWWATLAGGLVAGGLFLVAMLLA
jgi:hypothetical protein